MKKRDIAVYVVPTADYHESEYVGAYFKAREFITGFTGSAGTAVITMTEAGLWTDGRYFVQAAKQLEETGITLYRMGEEGVPTVNAYIEQKLGEGECLGFDGRVVNGCWGAELCGIADRKHGSVQAEEDLIDFIWEDRPLLSREPVWILDEKYSGRSTADKLAAVRDKMKEKGTEVYLLSSLYDIAWLLNVRGGDIRYVPVVLSYLALTQRQCIWFVQEEVLDDRLRDYLNENHITTQPYESFYDYIKTLDQKSVLLNKDVANYRICSSIPASAALVEGEDPTEIMRAVKNGTETENIRSAHVKDGIAMCRFMYWLEKPISEGFP